MTLDELIQKALWEVMALRHLHSSPPGDFVAEAVGTLTSRIGEHFTVEPLPRLFEP